MYDKKKAVRVATVSPDNDKRGNQLVLETYNFPSSTGRGVKGTKAKRGVDMKWAKGHKSSFLLVTRNLLSDCRYLRSIAGIQKQEKCYLLLFLNQNSSFAHSLLLRWSRKFHLEPTTLFHNNSNFTGLLNHLIDIKEPNRQHNEEEH